MWIIIRFLLFKPSSLLNPRSDTCWCRILMINTEMTHKAVHFYHINFLTIFCVFLRVSFIILIWLIILIILLLQQSPGVNQGGREDE